MVKPDIVQLYNPRIGRYVKIDRANGKIMAYKKGDGPYKGIPVGSEHRYEGRFLLPDLDPDTDGYVTEQGVPNAK